MSHLFDSLTNPFVRMLLSNRVMLVISTRGHLLVKLMTHFTRGYAGLNESWMYYQVELSNYEPYEKQSRNVTIYFF